MAVTRIIRSAVVENLMAASVVEPELWEIEVVQCRNRNFQPFWLLWPWTWLDDLHIRPFPYCREILRMWKYEFPTSRLSKVVVWQTHDRHRLRIYCRQTDKQDRNYIPCRFAGGKQEAPLTRRAQCVHRA